MTGPFSPGMVIERIELIELIGQGGQAQIWHVRDLEFPARRNVAIKLWHTLWDERGDSDFVDRDTRLNYEFDLIGNLNSQYIVTPYRRAGGQEEIDGETHVWFGVTMRLASERSLDLFLERHRKNLVDLDRFEFMDSLARGLKELQSHSIVHNDIKPQNILISRSRDHFEPSYADFGIAFELGDPPVSGGTPLYMAPELLRGASSSFKSDIFALGIVFCEILLGEHPFGAALGNGDLRKLVQSYYANRPTIDLPHSLDRVGEGLTSVVKKMCAFDPDRRPSIDEVIDAVETRLALERRTISANVAAIYPRVANRFRWSEGLHEALTERELLIFLGGNKPERDADFLSGKLIDHRLFGYSIFRLLGSSDYLLRIWRRDTDVAKLKDVLDQYRIHCGDYEIIEPTLRWPAHKRAVELAEWKVGQVYEALQSLIDDTSDAALVAAKRSGIIVGGSKTVREQAKARKSIRAVCRIVLKTRVSRDLAPIVGERLFNSISKRHFREVELLANSGPSDSTGEFILIAEFTDFHVYRDLLLSVGEVLSTFQVDAETRSLFEMDSTTSHESYDGCMLHELHQRRPNRRKGWDDGGSSK